jgi:hypothetical protein
VWGSRNGYILTAVTPNHPLTVITTPTATQHKALQLLGATL